MSIVDFALYAQDSYQRGESLPDADGTNFNGSIILDSRKSDADGFYAIAYELPKENAIIIAYRGTDGVFKDVLNGWGGGVGLWASDQNQLAMEFYHSVKDANPGKDISLTGHSLGGGLAGFVSSITGEKAVVFDNMTYKLSAKLAYFTAKVAETFTDLTGKTADDINTALDGVIKSLGFSVIDVIGETGKIKVDFGVLGFSPVVLAVDALTDLYALAESYYKGLPVSSPESISNVTQYATDGEVLSYLRLVAPGADSTIEYDAYFGGSERTDFKEIFELIGSGVKGFADGFKVGAQGGPHSGLVLGTANALFSVGKEALLQKVDEAVAKHSMALLTANLYLDENFTTSEKADIGFLGGSVFSHLYSDDVASKVGITGPEEGNAAAQLLSEIAYSGADGAGVPFGTVGLHAMFDDSRDAGAVLDGVDYNFNLGITLSGFAIRGALGSSIVQFSGELAHSANTDSVMKDGFIRTQGGELITIDYSEELWKSASGKSSYDTVGILGRDVVIDRFDYDDYFTGGVFFSDTIKGAINKYWGSSTDLIERLHYINSGTGVNLDLAAIDNSIQVGGANISSQVGHADFLRTTAYSDVVNGSARNEFIEGLGGNDILNGGGGDDILVGGRGSDTLNGGAGSDAAVYDGYIFNNESFLSFTLHFLNAKLNPFSSTPFGDEDKFYVVDDSDPTNVTVTEFKLGLLKPKATGNVDTLTGIEIIYGRNGEFKPNQGDIFADGPMVEKSANINLTDGTNIGVITLEAPSFSTDSDVDFNLNLSTSAVGTQYKIALIIDVSGSMGGSRIADAKAAYVDLINTLKAKGIADVAEFAVIPFSSSSTLYDGLTADQAIAQINSLNAGGGTYFGPPIAKGVEFFGTQADGNIAYFLSDGRGSGASTDLQAVADVRAFAIGSGTSISSLNLIDSNNAVVLNSAADLAASFTESEIKSADVDKIELWLNGSLYQTIQGDQLVDNGATGLGFSGTVTGLDPATADTLEAKVFFKDTSIPVQSVTFEVKDGNTDAVGTSGNDISVFGASQQTIYAGGGTDDITANNLDNVVEKSSGGGEVKLYAGNDVYKYGFGGPVAAKAFSADGVVAAAPAAPSVGGTIIDGGTGIDTVTYNGNFADFTVTQAGALIKVQGAGSAVDSLSNVEFIQFNDLKIRTSDLSTVSTLSMDAVEAVEGDSTSSLTFTVKLDAASGSDISFDYTTVNGTAEAGSDFTAANGTITILAGETEKTITIDIAGDIIFEGDEYFEVKLTNATGAVFTGGLDEYSALGQIKNDDDANETKDGTDGDDVINTGKGNDLINSGAGDDVVNANSGNDTVIDGLGNNVLNGQNGTDALITFSGLNVLNGGADSDFLAGGFQADQINGGAGNDVIRGEAGTGFLAGSDQINGGTGNDFLMGGRGADTFIFTTNDGDDVIAAFDTADLGYGPITGFTATATGSDFQSGIDHIQLAGFTTVDASNVMASLTDGADGAVFSAEGTSITFYGVDMVGITADDFIFV